MTDLLDPSRARRLKARTHDAHARLDARIMAGRPFEDRERYARFLTVQRAFHRDIDTLYSDPRLVALLPGLPERRRLKAIEQDLAISASRFPGTRRRPSSRPPTSIFPPPWVGSMSRKGRTSARRC